MYYLRKLFEMLINDYIFIKFKKMYGEKLVNINLNHS